MHGYGDMKRLTFALFALFAACGDDDDTTPDARPIDAAGGAADARPADAGAADAGSPDAS